MIDTIIIVLLLLGAFRGYRNGLISEITSLIALLLGFVAAYYFSGVTAQFLTEILGVGGRFLSILAFIVTLILVMMLIVGLGKVVEKFTESLMLGFFNRVTGAVFGLLKAALILSLLIMLLNFLKISDHLVPRSRKESSWFYPRLEIFAPALLRRTGAVKYLPDSMKDEMNQDEQSNEPAVII
ncbi:MAG TPA: CvpA family protein [Bacteroidales bacterium]|nr:CvpA family protein [Bacteroidales bacterium]